MGAIHVRNVPESVIAALRERAAKRGHSMQQELLGILEAAVATPLEAEAPPPIRLIKVKTDGTSTWSRDEIYGDEGR
jgi:plasmid stability protein